LLISFFHAFRIAVEIMQGCARIRWSWLLVLALLLGLMFAGPRLGLQEWGESLLDFIAGWGPWSAVVLIACYAVGSVLFIPGLILTLGAGAVFGVVKGCVVASIGSTLGATSAFLFGRHFLRHRIARRLEGNAIFAAMDRAVTKDGWKIVSLARLSPLFPYVLLNYAFALTQISFREYVAASWLGMIPATALYVYLGSLAQNANGRRMRTTAEWVLYGAGLVATIAVVVYLTRVSRDALARRVATEPPSGATLS
jgi:uncharacterized membrane protein YdjX (TVP38/TMEM64 family)